MAALVAYVWDGAQWVAPNTFGSVPEVEHAVEERSTARFSAVAERSVGDELFRSGTPVEVRTGANVLVFGGVIASSPCRPVDYTDQAVYTVTCADWHYLADKRLVAESFVDITAKQAIQYLLDHYLTAEGILAGTIQDGPVLTEVRFNYVPASECIDRLAELAGFVWYIDETKTLHFHARGAVAAPWSPTLADMEAGTIELNRANTQYRNRQYIKGGNLVTDPRTEVTVADGQETTFTVGFPIAKVPEVHVAGITGLGGSPVGGYLASSSYGLVVRVNGKSARITNFTMLSDLGGSVTVDVAPFTWGVGAGTTIHTATWSLAAGTARTVYPSAWTLSQGLYVIYPSTAPSMMRSDMAFPFADHDSAPLTVEGGGNVGTGGSVSRWYYFWNIGTEGEGRLGIKGLDEGQCWYWNKGEPSVTQDQDREKLPAGSTITVVYRGELRVVAIAQDYTETARLKERQGGTGRVEAVDAMEPTASGASPFSVASAKLERWGRIARTVTFATRRPGLRVGQLLTLDVPELCLHGVEAMVEAITYQARGRETPLYVVKLAQGPLQGSWTRLFSNIALFGSQLVESVLVGEDEVIIILAGPFAETASWAETSAVTVFACPLPAATLYPTATLYPC